jgi:hypothetical protein
MEKPAEAGSSLPLGDAFALELSGHMRSKHRSNNRID